MKILYIYPLRSSFIAQDIIILRKHYQVIEQRFDLSPKYLLPFNLVKQFFQLIFQIRKVDTIIVAFGGYHSLLPAIVSRIFRKKIFIGIHGTDATSFPEFKYGNYRKGALKWFTNKSFELADKLLPVSNSLLYSENNYLKNGPIKQGIIHFNPQLATPHRVIPNVFDHSFWTSSKKKKGNIFITISSSTNLALKGIDLICTVAPQMPDSLFYIVGLKDWKQFEQIPNIKIFPYVPKEQLKALYAHASFYLQLSISEGFGCALCEAMLCYCVPIVSNVNELPFIAGDTGWVLEKRDPDLLVKLLQTALNDVDYNVKSEKARQRIIENYSPSIREEMLLQEFEN